MRILDRLVWAPAALGLSWVALGLVSGVAAEDLETKPNAPLFARVNPKKAPVASGLLLREGDRLAICGDSITEQKMYSRMMETYLTVCAPQLKVTVRQYGWSGETAPGFLARMTNDCLRFKPTAATTCYGMNDHGYRAYEPAIGQRYREASLGIIRAFKAAGARVVHGSPGCVGSKVSWTKAASEDMNVNLCELRNIGIEIAGQEGVRFADVYWPMLTGGFAATEKYGADYAVAGKDAVHPDWSGQLLMAYAFLKALGLDGEIGTFTVEFQAGRAVASSGHKVLGFRDGELQLSSARYPFCATGALDKDNSIRSGMTLVPFNQELNRLMLVVTGAPSQGLRVTWGNSSRTYETAQLAKGINLAEDFPVNPFSEAFARVDAAVLAKQAYETRQIKLLFHGEEGRFDMEATAAFTEAIRARINSAIPAAFVPVSHTIRLEPQ
jgi:lysophospholipase L1-like esterase